MNRIRTSFNILKQSCRVMLQHPKLMLFPLLNFVGMLFIIAFFALPLLFETSVFTVREDFPAIIEMIGEQSAAREEVQEEVQEVQENGEHVFFGPGAFEGEPGWQPPFLPTAFLYLLTMFLLTFLNVAFYQQILQAFNGNPVSITRGLAFATTKLRAILMWSLLAGIVGIIIRKLEENVGFVGRWIMGLIGFTWSVASVFAIPVIIREEQQSNPMDYLKSSAALIRKTWGEGLAGIVSLSVLVLFIFVCFIPLVILLMIAFPFAAVYLLITIFCTIFILAFIAMVIRDIFLCGLYVYASEGVAPVAFDQELMEQGWKVKKKN